MFVTAPTLIVLGTKEGLHGEDRTGIADGEGKDEASHAFVTDAKRMRVRGRRGHEVDTGDWLRGGRHTIPTGTCLR